MGKAILHCKRSLETTDFNRYDIIADNRLFKREMSEAQYRCFLEQLIRTSDREVLKQFTDAIQNDLWERIRKDLKRISKSRKLNSAIKELVRTMMKHEFSGRVVRGDVTVHYNYDYLNIRNKVAGTPSREQFHVHQLQGVGVFRINVPLKDWRWKSKLTLTGTQQWSLASQESTEAGDSVITKDRKSSQGIQSDASISVLRRDSSMKFKLDTKLAKYWNPIADRLLRSYEFGGLFALRNIFKVPLSVTAQAKWSEKKYAQPADSSYNNRSTCLASANIEASYMFGKSAGLVGLYEFMDKSEITSFYKKEEYKHKPSVLAHIKLKRGHIRVGGGAGVWRDSLKLLGETNQTKSDGAELHANTKVFLKPKKHLSLQINANVNANYSEGDFKGWFPSWSSDFSFMVMYGKVYFKITEGYHGHHKDLQHQQAQHGIYTDLTLSYRPTTSLNFSLYGYHYYSRQTGHQKYIEQTWTAALIAGVRLVKKPDLWFRLAAYVIGYEYKQEGYKRDQLNVLSMSYLKLRF